MADQRLEALRRLLTVNDHILDDAVRHALAFERYKKHEVAEIVRFLEREVFPDVLRKVDGGIGALATTGLKAAKTKRVRDTLVSVNATISAGVRRAGDELSKSMSALAMSEAQWQSASLAKNVPIDGVSFDTPSLQTLRAIVRDEPINGRKMTDWMTGLSQQTQKRVQQQLLVGLTQGESVPSLMRRLRGTAANKFKDGVFQTTRREAQAIVRTSANHVSTRARELTFKENQDVVKAVQIVATLDSRTSDICMAYDGQTFPVDKGPRPPFHVNCRSTIVPVTKSWQELGAKKKTKVLKESRAAMNGQVSGKTTYGQWLKRQPVKVQNEALGVGRAKLFRAGKIGVEDLVGKFGKSLTLDQLEVLEGIKPPMKSVAAPPLSPMLHKHSSPIVGNKRSKIIEKLEVWDDAYAGGHLDELDEAWDDVIAAGFNFEIDAQDLIGVFEDAIDAGMDTAELRATWAMTHLSGIDVNELETHLIHWRNALAKGGLDNAAYYAARQRAFALGYPPLSAPPKAGNQVIEEWLNKSLDKLELALGGPGLKAPVAVVGFIDEVQQHALMKYVSAKSPSSRTHWKKKAIDAGWDPSKKLPKTLDELDEVLKVPAPPPVAPPPVAPPPVAPPPVAPVMPPDQQHALTKYINAKSASARTHWKKKAINAGWDPSKKLPKTLDELDEVLGTDSMVVPAPPPPPTTPPPTPKSMPQAQQHALKKYVTATSPSSRTYWKKKAWDAGHRGPLPKNLEDLEYLITNPNVREAGGVGVKTVQPVKPATIKVTPNQYDDLADLADDVSLSDSGLFSEYTAREVEYIARIRAAKKTGEVENILLEFFGNPTDAAMRIKLGRMDFEAAKDFGEVIVQMAHGVYDPAQPKHLPFTSLLQAATKWGEVGAPAMPKHAMGWSWHKGLQLNSRYFGKGKYQDYIYTRKLHHQQYLDNGQVPFKSSPHKTGTMVHEFGHQFAEPHARFRGDVQYPSYSLSWTLKSVAADLPEGRNLRAAYFRASMRFQDDIVEGRLKSNVVSGYATENSAEAFAEAWAKIILEDQSDWDETTAALYDLIQQEAKASGVKLPPYLRKGAAAGAPEGFVDVTKWEKIGEAKGSNPGGVYRDPKTGQKFYVKFYDDVEHVDNEVVANRLYREAGLETTRVHHGWAGGKHAVVSEWNDGVAKASQAQLQKHAMDGFATDAWLANWDSVGQTYDNMLINAQGGVVRVDAGGSLFFRAQGTAKGNMFGDTVGEMDTLIGGKNPQASQVFGQLTTEQKITSISRVESMTDDAIDRVVDGYWRGPDHTMRDELKRKLKARRNDLLKQRDKLLATLEEERKIAMASAEARRLGLVDPRPYDVRYKEWLNISAKAPSSLTKGEQAKIKSWTGVGYHKVREYQWKGHEEFARKHGEAVAKKQGRIVAELTRGLEKAPRYQGTIVRRMTIDSPERLAPWINEGSRIEFDTHYSFAKQTSSWAGNVTITIENSTKSSVDVQTLSKYNREREAIALKGTEYLIHRVVKSGKDNWDIFLREL